MARARKPYRVTITNVDRVVDCASDQTILHAVVSDNYLGRRIASPENVTPEWLSFARSFRRNSWGLHRLLRELAGTQHCPQGDGLMCAFRATFYSI